MFRRLADERGLTIIELMMVVAVMAVLMAISAYNFLADVPTYKLRSGTQRLAAHVQGLKMRAIATNRNAWLVPTPDSSFYTAFVDDQPPYGTIQASEYAVTKLAMPNKLGVTPGFYLPEGVTFGVPPGASTTIAPDGSTLPAGTEDGFSAADNNVGFRPSGLTVENMGLPATPLGSLWVFLKNNRGRGAAVEVAVTGSVRVWHYRDGAWK